MGGISSSDIAASLGLAASHYRMVEAGSAVLQPSRAIRIIQTFETIEFVPLCQILVAIQLIDSARQVQDMQAVASLIKEVSPGMGGLLRRFEGLWDVIEDAEPAEVARRITELGIDTELYTFLTTEPATLTSEEIRNFMTPTYEHPISGQLYDKIGNILQGVAPFYLDTVLQLIDNLKHITPRVTAGELARWEGSHKNRISYIIGVVRKPEIILDVHTFDYTFLWEANFRRMVLVHRDPPRTQGGSVSEQIAGCLRSKFQGERVKYESLLKDFESVIGGKLLVRHGEHSGERIDRLLQHQGMAMNNLWFYIMTTGYVVPFIDNAETGASPSDLFGTSLAYDETCERIALVRELLNDVGIKLA